MPAFNVHYFAVVRVKAPSIEAENAEEAIDRGKKTIPFHELFNREDPDTEWAEEIAYHLVDPLDKNEQANYDESEWFGPKKERGLAGVDDLFYKILNQKEILPVLMGIDPVLDRLIADKLKGR